MMASTLKQAHGELRLYPARFALVVFALMVGIWGVGSILISYYVLSGDLRDNYLNTRPAHAILYSNDFDKLNLTDFRARAEIEAAEFRDFSLHRIEISPDRWIPLWLYGISDIGNMQLARVEMEQGGMVPGAMVVERDGLRISDFETVKQPRVRFAQGIKQIPISGISFDPAQAPATQDHFIYAYMDQQSYAQVTGEPINRRLILRLNNADTKAQITKIVELIVGGLSKAGIQITKTQIPEPNKHPHQWQLDTLMLLQGSISLLAFVMAAVLVSQLMASILSRQIRQIGVLKAIGATRGRVLSIYTTMVLSLGIVAAILGIPLAVLTGYGFSYLVAYQLNFNILTIELPWMLYAVLIMVSFLLPLALALPILLRGTRIPVNAALSDYGVSTQTPASAVVSRWWSYLPRSVVMAMRNTLRQKQRLMITILTMALGVAIFSTGFNVRQSLATLLQENAESMRHDVRVVLKQSVTTSEATELFRSLQNVESVEFWNGGRGEVQHKLLSNSRGIGVTALPYDTDLMHPKIVKGHWLQGPNQAEMVMNLQAWELYGSPQIGSRLSFGMADKQLTLVLVGLVEEFDKPNIYIEQQYYDVVTNPMHQVNSFMFVAADHDYEAVQRLKQEIERLLASTNLQALEVMSHAERVKIIYDHLNIILSVLLFLAFTVLLVSALGMASAMGISIMERTREIGILRAVGATPAKIFRLFESEGMIVNVAAIILGLLLSWPLSAVAAGFFGDLMLGGANLRLVISGQGVWITLVTSLLFGWLASRIPARSAVRLTTGQALAYE